MSTPRERSAARDAVATKLKVRRLRMGLSLTEAAHRCGLSKAHLFKLEDDCNPSIETLLAIAQGYDCEMADLLPSREDVTRLAGLPKPRTAPDAAASKRHETQQTPEPDESVS